MKEIKFRAWDKREKQMLYSNLICGDTHLELPGIKYEKWSESDHADYIDSKIMQFTGLKDKNGKDIYEGDIVKYYHHPEEACVVKWDKELLTNKITVVSDGIECEDYFFIKSDSPKVEIIGDIYENPELLK